MSEKVSRRTTSLGQAARVVHTGKADVALIGDLVVMRASTFDAMQLALRKYREMYDQQHEPEPC